MKIAHALTSLVCLLIVCTSASGGIRPSFLLERCSWRATDIVVVTEDKEIDGVLKVLESWKGDLKPGQTITIPELEEFKRKEARLIHRWPTEGPSEYVSGARMVLFLRDGTKIPADSDEDESPLMKSQTTAERWRPANPMGDEIRYSTVWIEQDNAHGFVQIMNPGDSLLISLSMTEAALKTEVSNVIGVQNALDAALAVADPATRAESLEPFALDKVFPARERAFAGLVECGEAALPVLRRMLNNESLRPLHSEIVKTFAKAGRRTAGPELTAWLERELEFWKQTTPTLQDGWWNGKGFETLDDVKPLRHRSVAMYQAVYALGAIRYDEAQRAVIELNDYWRSVPHLDEGRIAEACDQVLRHFRRNNEAGKRLRPPKYEVSFSGNKAFSSSALTAKTAEFVAAYDALDNDDETHSNDDIFDYAFRRLLGFVRSQGYLNATLRQEHRTTANGKVISIHLDEGRQYRLGKIKIEGAKLFSPQRLRSMLALEEGDVANGEAISKWLHEAIDKAYADLGHLRCDVDEEHKIRAGAKDGAAAFIDFTVTIDEGQQFKVGKITFQGRTKLKPDQLSGAMLVREGEIFSWKQLDDSIEALKLLGLKLEKDDIGVFSDDEHDFVDIVIVVSKDHRLDGRFDRFSEKRNWYR